MTNEIDGLWDFSDAAASELRFREAVASEVGAQRELLRTQLARALGLQRRFEEGHSELDLIGEDLVRTHDELRVRCELERGRLFNSAGDREAASERFRIALDHAKAVGLDVLAVDAAHMLGISEPGDAGANWTRQAIEISEASEDPKARKWRASLLNNLGWSRFEAGEHAEALDCFERALDARREQGDAGAIRIARWCVARGLRELGRIDEAMAIQRELEADYERVGEPSGYVFEELGECHLLLGTPESARPFFAKAHRVLSADPWLQEREPERIERLKRLGDAGG